MRKAKLITILYYSYPSYILFIACGGAILFLFSKADFPWNSSQYIHDWLQNCFKLIFLSQNKPNLKPSWLQIDSSWSYVGPKLAPSWLKLSHVGSKLASSEKPSMRRHAPPLKLASSWLHVGSMLPPCWLHVGSMLAHVGSMLAHVGPSGLQDGSRCHYVDSGWPQDGQHGFQ